MDGDANGRIKCTLANWTGIAYKIFRDDLEKCEDREDFKKSGVYFLFGGSDDNNDNVVYIGQAGHRKSGDKGLLGRLKEHKKDNTKDYWNEAVIFTTANNSFGSTEISYLENAFVNMAKGSQRYTVKNSNEPNPSNVTEEKESELLEFIEYAKLVMGTFGHKVFEPLNPHKGEVFYINRNGSNAKVCFTKDGVLLLKGSKISNNILPSCHNYIKVKREKYKNDIDENFILKKDILFNSPSGASCFVVASSSNGYEDIKDKNGKSLKSINYDRGNI